MLFILSTLWIILFFSFLISIFLIIKSDLYIDIYAYSPSFYFQEIKDKRSDWINLTDKQYIVNNEHSIDILSVDYISDGKFLNATIWLSAPFKINSTKIIKYGMLIDTDFDKETGWDGIDNQFEIKWDNNIKNWTKNLEVWSYNGQQKNLQIENNNQNEFFKMKKDYVDLSLDLSLLHYPTKYKVTFYAEISENNHDITDVTRWVAIPPLELNIMTSPSSLVLTQPTSWILPANSNKTIEVKINSTHGYEPIVNLSARSLSGNINVNFKQGYDNNLRIPSYGITTVPLIVSANKTSNIAPDTILINANSSFPPDIVIGVKPSKNLSVLLPESEEKSYNLIQQITMPVDVQKPLSKIEELGSIWDILGAPITFFFGIAADRIIPWIYKSVNQYRNEKKKNS